MKTMKLADWCEKTGVKYLTAWRWFKADKMPVYAYQTDSGTILVEDESMEMNYDINTDSDALAIFLKKSLEFDRNKSSIEDFAAYIISNFSLKLLSSKEDSTIMNAQKSRPKSEDIQKHFKKFIPETATVDSLKMLKALLKNKKSTTTLSPLVVEKLISDISLSESESDEVFSSLENIEASVSSEKVDNELPPQHNNYTSSTEDTEAFNNFVNDIKLQDGIATGMTFKGDK